MTAPIILRPAKEGRMQKNTLGWIILLLVSIAVLATAAGTAEVEEFDLDGEGRETDLTSIEKRLDPEKNVKISITGNHPYRSETKGKISIYLRDGKKKVVTTKFSLKAGETKTWDFEAEKKIGLVNFGVYGKGSIVVGIEQIDEGHDLPDKDEKTPARTLSSSQPAADDPDVNAEASAFESAVVDAEQSYRGGDNLAAVEQLKKAMLAIWDEVPLTIKNVRFVKDTKTYATRKSNQFRLGEKIHITGQMFGYKMKRDGDSYLINITTDVHFLKDDQILAGQEDFGKFTVVSPIPNTEFRLDLTYWLNDAPKGAYDIQTIVYDRNSGNSTKFKNRIEIR